MILLLTFIFYLGCGSSRIEESLSAEEQDFISYGVKGGLLEIDSNWMFAELKFLSSDTILWYPLANMELEVAGPCDSCHGASANYFEFEYLTWMRDSLKTLFPPGLALRELTPGLFNLQEGHMIDSLHAELIQILKKGEFSLSELKKRAPYHDFWNAEFPSELQDILLALKSDIRGDYLLLPLGAKATLFPDRNKPQGKVEIDHHWVFIDYNTDRILISYYSHLVWHSGSYKIDRETSRLILNPMRQVLKGVQGSIPSWAQ